MVPSAHCGDAAMQDATRVKAPKRGSLPSNWAASPTHDSPTGDDHVQQKSRVTLGAPPLPGMRRLSLLSDLPSAASSRADS